MSKRRWTELDIIYFKGRRGRKKILSFSPWALLLKWVCVVCSSSMLSGWWLFFYSQGGHVSSRKSWQDKKRKKGSYRGRSTSERVSKRPTTHKKKPTFLASLPGHDQLEILPKKKTLLTHIFKNILKGTMYFDTYVL